MGNCLSRRKAVTEDGRDDGQELSSFEPELGIPPRFSACSILYRAGIPASVWLEDALAYHDVPTLVFDLFLLVPDVDAAARALVSAGYQRGELSLALSPIRQFDNLYIPLRTESQHATTDAESAPQSPEIDETRVILLPAKEWFHELPAAPEDMVDWFPTLPQLLTALIAKWLSLEEGDRDLRLRIAVFLGYIYEYLDTVKVPRFEQQLPQQFRTFHSDQVQGINAADLGTFRCQEYYMRHIGQHYPVVA
ncbi:hypothetical protein C8A00DRAFT_16926 [Chaetomidium leptoderma]|uniref:Uncharacterized protein n=1 Tax=Chaetomidium leptoderma TaxID=669021 RepID=A0AAN6ZTU5_9PEZI|nr:hypothetical protein C8A00DRAFT_16926 [Chaetomidium leptoderma]